LIHTFVFGWAMEWVLFVVEVTSVFVFYYCWERLPRKTHVIVGWIYAFSAWGSLVLITGITAFMLHPGDWLEEGGFWTAFFNPQFLPQVVARTGGALLLSSLYVYLHASLTIKDRTMCDRIEARSTRPALVGAAMIGFGGVAWYLFLPPSAKAALAGAAVLNVLTVLILAVTVAVFVALYLGPYRNPGWMSPGFSGLLLLCGMVAFSTGEFIREAVRKPYVVYNVVLGNQVLTDEVAALRESGYLEGGTWTRAFVTEHYPDLVENGQIDEAGLLQLPPQDRVVLGEVLFQYHCNNCHSAARGHSAVGPLLRGRSLESIRATVENLNEVLFMPPWAGKPEEAQLLAEYLKSIAPPRAEGMKPVLPESGE